MKRTRILLRIIVCVLFMLSALAFAAIQGMQLFSEDWKLFENHRLALAQIIVKTLLCLCCFAITLRAALHRDRPSLWEGGWLLGMTLAAAPFVSNHLGDLFVLFAVLFLVSEPRVWRILFDRRKETVEKLD